MSLMPLHHQSPLGFFTRLVPLLILLNCSLLLVSDVVYCGARLAPVSLATKMLAFKLICYFSSHPAAFVFCSSTAPDNITLTPTNRKADKSLSEFLTDIGAAAYTTLSMEQLISHLTVALVDAISSLPHSEGGAIPVSEVCELLIKDHDILDNVGPNKLATQLMF